MKALVVTNPFGEYEKGIVIKDEAKIEEILASENAQSVVVVELTQE